MPDQEQVQFSSPHAATAVAPATASLALNEPDNETAEAMRRTFEEIGSSSSRIVKRLERLNSLAQEIYCELDATTKALSSHG